MTIVAIIGIAWTLASVVAALAFGRGIARADRTETAPAWTDEVEQFLREQAAQQTT